MEKTNFIIRPYTKEDCDYVAEAHERIYMEEYGWGEGFYKYAQQVAYDYRDAPEHDREGFWIAESEGKPIGCVMLVRTENPDTAKLRLFLVEKPYRQHGVGSALVDTLMENAHSWGYKHMELWTAEPLHDARRYYGKKGFLKTEENVNTDWRTDGGEVIEEKWEKDL